MKLLREIFPVLCIALEEKFNLVGVCPEVLGGLPCPRQPAEISRDREVLTQSGQVLSTFFLKGAHEALNICKNYGIQLAVLKSKSPSCGFGKLTETESLPIYCLKTALKSLMSQNLMRGSKL